MPSPPTDPLDEALTRIAGAHGAPIDPGLERIGRVARRAGLVEVDVPLVTVAGTNGKGSTVAMLEAIWQGAGYLVGTSTSPHLVRFGERVRIDGRAVSDEALLESLEAVRAHLAPDTLTYFELASLLAMHRFLADGCEVIVLEVGLGGRLDAANLWDCDVAVLTSVALDHADWLGTDLDVIATEKAAIGRRGRPLVVAPPPSGEALRPSLAPFARERGIDLIVADLARVTGQLALTGEHQRRNAACAIEVIDRLQRRLPMSPEALHAGLADARVDARMECRSVDGVPVLLDVAHNPAAARALAAALSPEPYHLLFAAYADKDIEGIVDALAERIGSIACVALHGERALPVTALATRVRAGLPESRRGTVAVTTFDTLQEGDRAQRRRAARDGGRLLVAGSFQTVGAWLALHPSVPG